MPTPSDSNNFAFLARHDPALVRLATLAERYLFDDAPTALTKLRQFGEALAQQTAASFFRIRLWNAAELVEAVLKNYEKFSEDLQAELPLKRVWALVIEERGG